MTRVPLRRIARVVPGGTPTPDDANWGGGVAWATPVDLGRVDAGHISATDRTLTYRGLSTGSKSVPAGSLILSTRAPIGYVAQTDRVMAFNQGCKGLVLTNDVDPRFLTYELWAAREELQALGTGSTFLELSTEALLSHVVHHPKLAEQQRIADFLDDQVARIDAIVHLRAEQSSALEASLDAQIFAAVSGINESCEKRASGLPWLGAIPDHWKVATVGSQFSVMLGKMLNEERARGTSLRPYLRNVNVQWDQIDVSDLAEMNFPPSERRRYEVLPGDLLICEGGQPGRAAIWRGEVGEIYYQKALHRARPRQDCADVRWLFYLLRAAVTMDVFAAQGNQATIAHLTGEQLRAQRFPFPPLSEQASLIARLDAAAEEIEAAKGEMHAVIDLLKERKRSLITAAVTGDFDVSTASGRGVA